MTEADSNGCLDDSGSLRLLVVLEQVRPTGLVRQLLEMLERLPSQGVSPALACISREGVDTSALREECEGRGIRRIPISERGRFDFSPLRQVADVVRDWRPHAIQTHGYKSSTLAYLLTRRRSLPWIAFYHGRTTTDRKVRLYHGLERRLLSRANRIVAVSDGVEEHLMPGDRARIEVIPNGVVASPTQGVSYERPPGSPVLGFVGRLSHEKGCDIFLEVLAALRSDLPQVTGLVVGDGPERLRLEGMAKRLELADSVHFDGWVDNLTGRYAVMDALVISSRSEVFPNVLLEGVLAGLPVAATPVGGIPTIAGPIDTVHVSAGVTPPDLALAVLAALEATTDDLEESKVHVLSRYDQETRARRLAGIVHDLAGEP